MQMIPVRGPHSYSRQSADLVDYSCADGEFDHYVKDVLSTHTVFCPQQGYYFVEKGFVYDGKFVVNEHGVALADSFDDYPETNRLISKIFDEVKMGNFWTDEFPSSLSVVFAKYGSGNYGHFLTDCLPKLLNIRRFHSGPIRIILPAEAQQFQLVVTDFATRIGLRADVELHTPRQLYKLENFVYMSSVVRHNVRKSGVTRDMASVISGMYNCDFRGPEKIYVTRSKNAIRHITNTAEIENEFEQAGFVVVRPELYDFSSQVDLFRSAKVVAGPLGAGLSNMLWASEDTHVLMIDPGLTDFYFWDLASLRKQRFTWFFAGEAKRYSVQAEETPFYCPPARVKQLLRQPE